MQPEMQEFLANAQAFEQRMRDAELSLRRTRVTGRSADGAVTVAATGLGQVQSVEVDPAVFDHRDAHRLATAIAEAIRETAAAARRLAEELMGPVEINLY
jgi:DNA-binding YbaB/EbfC family protein